MALFQGLGGASAKAKRNLLKAREIIVKTTKTAFWKASGAASLKTSETASPKAGGLELKNAVPDPKRERPEDEKPQLRIRSSPACSWALPW